MDKYEKIRYWVEDLPKRGKTTFTQKDVDSQFAEMTRQNISNALNRLVIKKKIQSVWRGFWVVVPVEYGLSGIVDPVEYIDQLMKHLGKQYYIGLLSAASLHGAAHQQPMELMLVSNARSLRDKVKDDVKISFVTRKDIPHKYLQQRMTRNGYINVSSPELTAMDLLAYVKQIGGINRAATILNELVEVVHFESVGNDFFGFFDTTIIQRAGYLLDELGFTEQANIFHEKAQKANLNFRTFPLCFEKNTNVLKEFPIDKKWKLIINEIIETDDL
ncbi:MAG: type IV toxin-antitoxin system AbiEi family antitoxin [Tannerellaceae bacterium]|nr:type IV toxin-antitoxin system AbiEi family antitoxin [Tannerellaceae bacterium]